MTRSVTLTLGLGCVMRPATYVIMEESVAGSVNELARASTRVAVQPAVVDGIEQVAEDLGHTQRIVGVASMQMGERTQQQ